MSAYKAIGRSTKETPSCYAGKPNKIINKRIYPNEKSFMRYAFETARRWKRDKKLSVGFYKMIGDGWQQIYTPEESE